MKTRILAVLLALAVVLALALPTLAAVPADTVPYNTGTRHETCTALSTQAEQYYTDGAETLLSCPAAPRTARSRAWPAPFTARCSP